MATQKCVRVISLCGSLLVFQCERTNPKGAEIAFWRMAFSQDLGGFFNKDGRTRSMYKNSSRDVDVVCCTSAVDVKSRQKVPCILLRLRKKASQCFKYMLYSLDGSASARLHVEFALPYEVGDRISVLRGPTLVWSHEDRVFYTSSDVGGVREVPIPLTVSFVGELPLPQRGIGILGSEIGQREDLFEANKANEILLYFLEDGRTFRGTCLLPDAYNSVIKCMEVLSAEEADESLRSTVLAATCRKQLVRFENGLPEDVCALPYEQPQSIRIVHGGDGGCIIAVVFNQGKVCAVWKDSFKVAACWTGVSSLLVDDFLGYGSEQMLLLFEDPAEEILGNFLLTDLCGVHYSCGRADREDLHRSDPAQENVLLTVKALDSRLQSGLAFLQELQRDLSVKERVLQQSVTALADLVSDREHVPPPPQQEGLVSVWDEDSEEEDKEGYVLDEEMQTGPGHCAPEVKRFWHRVVGESLVFGMLLKPNTDVSEGCVTGSVLLEPSGGVASSVVVQSRSKTLPYPELPPTAGLDLDPPSAKRSRTPPGGSEAHRPPQLALLTSTDLTAGLLSCSRVTCSVLLHSSSPKSGPAVRQCSRFSLDIKDVLHGALDPGLLRDCSAVSDESREDLLSLLAACESWLFRVESFEHTLVDMSAWLVDRLGAKPVGVSPQYLLIRSTQPSSTMLIHWQPYGSFQALLRVHCSGQFAVVRFLHSLCDFLPASHHVRPLRSSAPREDGQGLTFYLEREIRTLKEDMASLFRDGQEVEEQGFRDEAWQTPASPERLNRCRGEWQRERERSSRALHPQVDALQYRTLLDSLIQAQLDGDIAALVEAQRGEG
ncbi:Fanconi anemia group B protein [Salminus brasiliensis]|uniref:Fanconi anemia group B protein n=1 Tax=Salminus brasiliensis TaxID=930266 RepID=UPI003B837ABD